MMWLLTFLYFEITDFIIDQIKSKPYEEKS